MLPRSVQEKLQSLSLAYLIDGREDKGSNGWLFFATNRVTGVKVAIKFYYWGDEPALHVEPRSLAQFNSPNIVPVLAAELAGDGWACFISPRFASDVEGLISRGGVSIHQALDISLNIFSGVGSLHASGIVHRDLKPANILLGDDGVAVIGDFGSVASLDAARVDAPASQHSIIYRPPETFETGRFAPTGDLYQIGLVLYELVGGSLPKDPLSWLTARQRAEHDVIESECDRSLFQDMVLRNLIVAGRVVKLSSIPFWVSSRIRNAVGRLAASSVARRPSTVGEAMGVLLSLRRETLNWVGTDFGAVGTFDRGAAKVVISTTGHRVDVDRGSGWRRDKSMERSSPAASCLAISQRFA